MKTPDEIKKELLCCSYPYMSCSECPYDGICRTASGQMPEDDAIALIDELLTSYGQVSKALCGKENATTSELLQAVSQLKDRLAQAERERDAAVCDLSDACKYCKHISCDDEDETSPCKDCMQRKGGVPFGPMIRTHFEWRGLCEDNTHDQPSM